VLGLLAFGCVPSNLVDVVTGDGIVCVVDAAGDLACADAFDQATPPPKATVREVSIGAGVACAILLGDSSIRCWGDSERALEAPSGEFASVAVSHYLMPGACAIHASGLLECWGEEFGSIPATTWAQVAMGYNWQIGISAEDGQAYCWGTAIADDCGLHPEGREVIEVVSSLEGYCALYDDGEAECDMTAWKSPAHDVPEGERFTDIAVGGAFGCGVREGDGTLVCWGRNDEYGINPPPGRFVSVSAGLYQVCALGAGGEAWCWGLTAEESMPGLRDIAHVSGNDGGTDGW
jgi:hypothetical protein